MFLSTGASKNLRIVILGTSKCGKSAVTVRYLTKRFIGEYSSSKDFLYHQTLHCETEKTEVEILDTSGCKTVQCLQDHIVWGEAFVIVYSICDRASFQQAKRLVECVSRVKSALQTSSCSRSRIISGHLRDGQSQLNTLGNHSESEGSRNGWRSDSDNNTRNVRLFHRGSSCSSTSASSSHSSPTEDEEENEENEPTKNHCTPSLIYSSSSTASDVPLILLGNKRDLEHVRQVMIEEAQEFALRFRCQFHEVSAADSFVGVSLAFQGLVREARASSALFGSPSSHTHWCSANANIAVPNEQRHGSICTCCNSDTLVSTDTITCAVPSADVLKTHQLQLNLRRKSSSAMSVSKMIGIVFGSKSARQKKRPSLSI